MAAEVSNSINGFNRDKLADVGIFILDAGLGKMKKINW